MKRYIIGAIIGFLVGFNVAAVLAADPGRLYHKMVDTVVEVHTANGSGTGVIINRAGDVLTNAHIVDYATATVAVITYPGNAFYSAKVIKLDKRKDLALLDVEGKGMDWPYIKIRKREVYIGETVYSIGHPSNNSWAFSKGMITGPRIYFNYRERTRCDVVSNPGSSGSPLFDKHGRLVGLVMGMYQKRWGGWAGVALAVSLKDVRTFMKRKPKLGDLKWKKQSRIRNRTSETEANSILYDALNAVTVPGDARTMPWR